MGSDDDDSEIPADRLSILQCFGRVHSAATLSAEQRFAYGRDREVELLARHLDHARYKSFVLVGPSGCGKTAIMYEFAKAVATRDLRTGVTTYHLAELWKGALDEFLVTALNRQAPSTAP